jgi:hypothetical protein
MPTYSSATSSQFRVPNSLKLPYLSSPTTAYPAFLANHAREATFERIRSRSHHNFLGHCHVYVRKLFSLDGCTVSQVLSKASEETFSRRAASLSPCFVLPGCCDALGCPCERGLHSSSSCSSPSFIALFHRPLSSPSFRLALVVLLLIALFHATWLTRALTKFVGRAFCAAHAPDTDAFQAPSPVVWPHLHPLHALVNRNLASYPQYRPSRYVSLESLNLWRLSLPANIVHLIFLRISMTLLLFLPTLYFLRDSPPPMRLTRVLPPCCPWLQLLSSFLFSGS